MYRYIMYTKISWCAPRGGERQIQQHRVQRLPIRQQSSAQCPYIYTYICIYIYMRIFYIYIYIYMYIYESIYA